MTDYTKLVKELRGCKYIDYCNDCPRMAANGYVEICNIKDDAAAAIEALQAEVPKRGEWIVTTETSDDGAVSKHINCSVCGFYWREPKHRKVFKRCPNCGAKMREVRDG